MSTLQQIRQGMSRAWDSVADGWRELKDLAGDELTRFQPKTTRDDESGESALVRRTSRWGLLAAEVVDDDETVRVSLEVPGLSADDFDIEVQGDVLIVRGEKRFSQERRSGNYHVLERAYGQFERAIRLPAAVDTEEANARYRSGVLSIELRKSSTARPRRIRVEAS
ncbi:MAG: Hsp20/alpha crystallin family protein [Woeseiaceae bacterium]|nr:Hsp20/alpha crystallin family protein [Woeseiaceae bacterium]